MTEKYVKDLLFNFTLDTISERNENHSSFPRDEIVKEAIEKYLAEENERDRARNFIEAFNTLLQERQKGELIRTFIHFIKSEIINESFLDNYQNHYIHSIQVYLFGYNIMTHWSYLTRQFRRRNAPRLFKFENFNFGWIIASMFHDEKYFVENQPDILQRQRRFLSPFQIIPDDIDTSYDTIITEKLEKYAKIIYKDFTNLLKRGSRISISENMRRTRVMRIPTITYENFKELFDIKVDNVVDHGFLSAINYIIFLEKTQNQYRINKIPELINKYDNTSDLLQQCLVKDYLVDHYLELRNELDNIKYIIDEIGRVFLKWDINKSAYLAIALHNFKQNKFEKFNFDYSIGLSCRNKEEILPYLLIICDNIQEWDRKLNARIIIDNAGIKLKKFKKDEEVVGDMVVIFKRLTNISFTENRANLSINHVFKNIIHEDNMKSEFKLRLLTAYKNLLEDEFEKITKKLPIYVNIHENNKFFPDNQILEGNNLNFDMLTTFILEPFNDENKYEIIISHLIEGVFYATAHFFL